MRAILVPVGAIVGTFVTAIAMNLAGVDMNSSIAQAIGKGALLLVAVSIAYGIWTGPSVVYRYRCPQCGSKTMKVEEALPDIHKYCAACNVEWDTGLRRSESSSYD